MNCAVAVADGPSRHGRSGHAGPDLHVLHDHPGPYVGQFSRWSRWPSSPAPWPLGIWTGSHEQHDVEPPSSPSPRGAPVGTRPPGASRPAPPPRAPSGASPGHGCRSGRSSSSGPAPRLGHRPAGAGSVCRAVQAAAHKVGGYTGRRRQGAREPQAAWGGRAIPVYHLPLRVLDPLP